jgi:hypothetical protein
MDAKVMHMGMLLHETFDLWWYQNSIQNLWLDFQPVLQAGQTVAARDRVCKRVNTLLKEKIKLMDTMMLL